MEDIGEEQYEHDPVVVLKQAIMTVVIDKSNDQSSANNYHEATIYKLRSNGITCRNEFIFMYDANPSSINVQLGNRSFIGMFADALEQIWSVINNICNNSMIPIKPSTLKDDEIPIPYHHFKKGIYKILNWNLLQMDWLLPIKWNNNVLKKIWFVDGNTMWKLNNLLVRGTLNTSLASVWQQIFHITNIKSSKAFLNC